MREERVVLRMSEHFVGYVVFPVPSPALGNAPQGRACSPAAGLLQHRIN